ncbi:MAG TPA: AAA family ATPase [Vicinamibacterales bacterium]|nr:AAA family ATPase [Vicinamibacterales bacterium]
MTTDQRDVIAFLSTPSAYGRQDAIERIDTHISIVWLVGERVFKLKRAVRYDYVDYSTVERRRWACEAEVRLNRRTAPAIYLGVRPVTLEADGQLALGGKGTPVDWLVEMARFDQQTLFDRLAEQHRLEIGLMEGLADAIASLHARAEPRFDRGGRDGMAWVIDGNARGFAEQGVSILDLDACTRLTADARSELARQGTRLDDRRRRGLVRECHGDLHLRNICLVDGVPTLFDAIEFNDDISCIDVVYDLAFLLMDLWRRGLPLHANLVFNEYMTQTGDFESLSLLPLFLSCRAAVRAKTSATAASIQPDEQQQRLAGAAAGEYLSLAGNLLRARTPCLVAVGGFSGSGKSTLARAVAPILGHAPGALILRSDVIRKMHLGVDPMTRLDADAYAGDISARVYRILADRARAALEAGHAVIADAVHARAADRLAIETVARQLEVPFVGLWIDGPESLLRSRLRGRARDASDATDEVLELQVRSGTGPLAWHRLDGSESPDQVRQAAAAVLAGSAVASSVTAL